METFRPPTIRFSPGVPRRPALALPASVLCLALLGGCMQARMDESREMQTKIASDEAVVILAKPQIEGAAAEDGFMDCVGASALRSRAVTELARPSRSFEAQPRRSAASGRGRGRNPEPSAAAAGATALTAAGPSELLVATTPWRPSAPRHGRAN